MTRNGGGGSPGLSSRTGRAVFGDRIGVVLFLSTLLVVTATWRAGLFITDNATLTHTLDALSQGRFWIEPAGEGALASPGTGVRDGLVYGRNYGQLVLSLPALWAFRALDALVNLRVALIAGWHLLALALVVHASRLLDRRPTLPAAGSALVLGSFLLNVALATRFSSPPISLLALQVTSAVATALVAVVVYRLLHRRASATVSALAGAGAVLAMPLGFWATIPKRHAFTALFVVAIVLAFARSRESDARQGLPLVGAVPVYRAMAYVLVGLLTWIHAAEGLFVFLALVAIDLPTAPTNDRRTLAVVTGAFALSLVPVLVTNLAVTGEFFRPPRGLGRGTITSGTAGGGSSSQPGVLAFIASSPVGWFAEQVLGLVTESVWRLTDAGVVRRTFLQSSVEGISQDPRFLGVNLSVLEAAPVLGVALAGAVASLRHLGDLRERVTGTDALALAMVVAFVLLYLNRLPLNTQITVRYLLPVYPLGAFLLARSVVVRRLLADYRRLLLWSYCLGVCIGGQLLFVTLVAGEFATAEAARVHATVGLTLGLALAAVATVGVFRTRARSVAAVALGLAAAAGTVLFLLATLWYFSFVGEYVLPVAGALSELLARAG